MSSAEQLEIWWAELDFRTAKELADLEAELNADELARARRKLSRVEHDRYVAARGTTRQVLGNYLGVQARDLEFSTGGFGKPFVSGPTDLAAFEFNISHSDGHLLVAIARGRRVGVDIERIRANSGWPRLARRFYSASECAQLSALPGDFAHQCFYRMWTAKEALLKATGEGLTVPISAIEIELSSEDGTSRIASIGGNQAEALRWRLLPVETNANFTASVVFEKLPLVR